ncbi:MAG TPA: AAA family ATPase, partial [Oligoflexia bacterium]|nr:AAA family ATPase [Oligoflexia bacterium]
MLAERVMKLFGDKALEIIDLHPERLLEVPGIGSRKLEEIREAWQKKRSVREVMLFFQNHGISINLAQRIFNAYGERAIEVVTRNPYLLARDVWGIGFQTADAIARALGTDPKARERIIAGISYVLQQASDDGHCFLPRDVLLTKTASLLVLDEEELLSSALADAELRADVVREDTRIYLPSLWQAETQLAHCIAERLRSCARPLPAIAAKFVHSVCEQAQLGHAPSGAAPSPGNRDAVIRLSEQQKQAVHLAADSSMIIVTGGPGCGKTTVVRVMAQMLRKAGLQVKLCAPTGRAAQRLAELCGMPASTIHRLLKYDPVARGFQHDPNNLLPLQALIVDECSMIDVPLAAALLRAVPPSARIILVGDADQLPSVGPGLFFNDLLDVQQIPRVRLTVLFRRAEESLITSIAHQINSAVVPEIPEPDGATKSDAYFLPASDAENAAALVERLVVEQIPKKFGFRGTDITVLTPVNQGVLGVQALNRRLQERLVPPLPGLPRVTVGELELRHGDRVIQRVNNYNIHPAGVFNGDQGEVVGVDAESRSIFIRLWDGHEIQYDA